MFHGIKWMEFYSCRKGEKKKKDKKILCYTLSCIKVMSRGLCWVFNKNWILFLKFIEWPLSFSRNLSCWWRPVRKFTYLLCVVPENQPPLSFPSLLRTSLIQEYSKKKREKKRRRGGKWHFALSPWMSLVAVLFGGIRNLCHTSRFMIKNGFPKFKTVYISYCTLLRQTPGQRFCFFLIIILI